MKKQDRKDYLLDCFLHDSYTPAEQKEFEQYCRMYPDYAEQANSLKAGLDNLRQEHEDEMFRDFDFTLTDKESEDNIRKKFREYEEKRRSKPFTGIFQFENRPLLRKSVLRVAAVFLPLALVMASLWFSMKAKGFENEVEVYEASAVNDEESELLAYSAEGNAKKSMGFTDEDTRLLMSDDQVSKIHTGKDITNPTAGKKVNKMTGEKDAKAFLQAQKNENALAKEKKKEDPLIARGAKANDPEKTVTKGIFESIPLKDERILAMNKAGNYKRGTSTGPELIGFEMGNGIDEDLNFEIGTFKLNFAEETEEEIILKLYTAATEETPVILEVPEGSKDFKPEKALNPGRYYIDIFSEYEEYYTTVRFTVGK